MKNLEYLRTEVIETRATELLHSLKIEEIPVRVDVVAHRLGLVIEETSLGEEVSGVLMIEQGNGTIGINKSHSLVRKRFSIAHEVGHFVLHHKETDLFIDRRFTAFRDSNSSAGEFRAEIQANQFAAALLMPRAALKREVKTRGWDLVDDVALRNLAEDFQVSVQAMAIRLSNLDIF